MTSAWATIKAALPDQIDVTVTITAVWTAGYRDVPDCPGCHAAKGEPHADPWCWVMREHQAPEIRAKHPALADLLYRREDGGDDILYRDDDGLIQSSPGY